MTTGSAITVIVASFMMAMAVELMMPLLLTMHLLPPKLHMLHLLLILLNLSMFPLLQVTQSISKEISRQVRT